MARELDDAILLLRANEPEIGTVVLKTRGDIASVLACDAAMVRHRDHWFVRETIGCLRRALQRLEVSSRSLFAIIDKGRVLPAVCSSWRSPPIAATCSPTARKWRWGQSISAASK